jgi:Max protein
MLPLPITLPTAEMCGMRMSDDEMELDIDSEDESLDSNGMSSSDSRNGNIVFQSQEERRAHHNALERKRRDHIKDSFSSLRDSIPSLQGEKSSRAQILKKAAEYISFMKKKNTAHQQDVDDLKRHNEILEEQILAMEKMKAERNREETEAFRNSRSPSTPPL